MAILYLQAWSNIKVIGLEGPVKHDVEAEEQQAGCTVFPLQARGGRRTNLPTPGWTPCANIMADSAHRECSTGNRKEPVPPVWVSEGVVRCSQSLSDGERELAIPAVYIAMLRIECSEKWLSHIREIAQSSPSSKCVKSSHFLLNQG